MKLYNKNNNYFCIVYVRLLNDFRYIIITQYTRYMLAEPQPVPVSRHNTTNNYTFDSCKPFSIVNYLRWRFCSCFFFFFCVPHKAFTHKYTLLRRGKESSIDLRPCLMYYSYINIHICIHFNVNYCGTQTFTQIAIEQQKKKKIAVGLS